MSDSTPDSNPTKIHDHADIATHPLATPTLNDPAFKSVTMSRSLTHGGRGHTLTGKTWNTPDTIASLHSFYRFPSLSNTSSPELRRFYTFGSGLNAHPSTLHGGVIAVILDSSLGGAVGLGVGAPPPSTTFSSTSSSSNSPNSSSSPFSPGSRSTNTSRTQRQGPRSTYYTVQLNTKYEKPVRTPGTVCVRAWVVRVEGDGRKVWAEGLVEGWDAAKGQVITHAKGEGLWVRTRERGGGAKV
jgi:acyl-coenzyme A thioesterase PaaI-like protein